MDADLNRFYRQEKVLHRNDCSSQGFEWVDCDNADESVISWQRQDPDTEKLFWWSSITLQWPDINTVWGCSMQGFGRSASTAIHHTTEGVA